MIVGYVFDTPRLQVLFVLALGTQQFAIAGAHQCEAALHEPDGSIAEIVRFPRNIWDTSLAEQCFGDLTISVTGRARIERADGGAQPFAPLFG